MGSKNGLSSSLVGSGMCMSTASSSFRMEFSPSSGLRCWGKGGHYHGQWAGEALLRGWGREGGTHLQGAEGRAHNDGRLLPIVAKLGEQLPDLQLHQLQHLLVLHCIRLVDVHHNVPHPDLRGPQGEGQPSQPQPSPWGGDPLAHSPHPGLLAKTPVTLCTPQQHPVSPIFTTGIGL